jgi:hypothetical protein
MGGFVITPGPAAYFGVGAIEKLPAIGHSLGALADEVLRTTPRPRPAPTSTACCPAG